jgi:salicylate hydroxylase
MSSPSPNQPINVAVVGGGFAGLALLIGLQKYSHINAHVYESSHQFAEVGAGAVLGPNSQRAMSLIDPRILDGFQRRAVFGIQEPDENGLYSWATVVKGQAPDIDERVMHFQHKVKDSTIHRAHFLDELIKLVEPHRAHFGKRVVEIREGGGGHNDPLILQFSDDTTVEADVVIGADGIHSVVRKHILGPSHPAANAFFTGAIAYRVAVPIDLARAKLVDVTPRFAMKCGKDGLVFGFPMSNHSVYYIAVVTFNNDPVRHDQWMVPPDVAELRKRFADYEDFVRKQVDLVPDDGSTLGWSIWEMPPAPTYYSGRVAMIGDAAHASPPFQGAGAGQSIEDALVMEQLLGKYLDPARQSIYPLSAVKTVPLVFQAYDTVRRFRSQKVVTNSAETGRVLTGNERGVTMRAADIRERLKDREDWIFECDQAKQVRDAMLLFEEAETPLARAAANGFT